MAWTAKSLVEASSRANESASVTHNHPDGIRGAAATAAAVYLARTGESKETIRDYVSNNFEYDLIRKLVDIRDDYIFDVSCSGSVPEAIIAFLESDGFESAVRNAVSLGSRASAVATRF